MVLLVRREQCDAARAALASSAVSRYSRRAACWFWIALPFLPTQRVQAVSKKALASGGLKPFETTATVMTDESGVAFVVRTMAEVCVQQALWVWHGRCVCAAELYESALWV